MSTRLTRFSLPFVKSLNTQHFSKKIEKSFQNLKQFQTENRNTNLQLTQMKTKQALDISAQFIEFIIYSIH